MAALDERSIFIKTRTQSSMYLETVEDKNESMMLSKASSELEFDIVEFWVTELVDNQVDHSCAYVYYNLSITESFPELTSIRFPISTIAAPFSKKLCSKASFAKERVYIGTQIEPEKKPRSPTASFFQVKKTVPEVQHPIASEVSSCLSYKLTSSSKCCDVFLIAYALHKVDYSEEKLNLLLNLADSAMSDTVHSLESTINYGDGKRSAAEEELDVKQFLPRRLSSTPVTRKKLSNLGRSNAENHRTLRKYTQELIKVSSLDSNSKSTGVRTNDSADYLGDITLVENCTVSSSEDPEDEVDETFHYPFHEIPVAVEVPDTLCWDDFTEVKYLADGSNANVYTANLSETKVVIKMIKVESLKNKIAMKEFDDEIMLLSRMNHKNIVKILGCGYSPRKFIVMEYLGAGTMTQLLAKNESSKGRKLRKPTFTYFRLLSYAKDMAEALDYLHHRCFRGAVILHRDLKPDNIGFKEDGTLKLFDFGLAVCVRVRHYLAMSYDMSGNTGSLRYMAPEVAKNLAYTEKVDVYSYGIVLWQMARESLPFAGLNKREFIKRVVEKGERPPIDPEWPPDFSRILEWCWQTDPMARPTFAVVVAEINTILMNDLDFH